VLTLHAFPKPHFAQSGPPQSTSVSAPSFAPSAHAAPRQTFPWQMPLRQSAPDAHAFWFAHFGHAAPPQSVSDSPSFFTPSLQLGAAHLPFVQTMLEQSFAMMHVFPGSHLFVHDGPPQSMSVSSPFFTPSMHVIVASLCGTKMTSAGPASRSGIGPSPVGSIPHPWESAVVRATAATNEATQAASRGIPTIMIRALPRKALRSIHMRDRLRRAKDTLRLAPVILRAQAIDRAAHAFARLRYMMPDAHPARFDVALIRDVAYRAPHDDGDRESQAHLLDVYVPTRTPKPLPVVMYVHGGAFCMLSKETHRVMALAIARAGYLVFNINYRLGPRHTYPAPLEDASQALVWVARNAARYGGDPSRVAIAGESAGANLVTGDENIALRAAIATYGFLDIGYIDRYLAHPRIPLWTKALLLDAAKSYVGPDVCEAARALPLASPLTIIESDARPERALPPFFLSVGTKDPLFRCSKRLKAALDRRGTPSELHVSPGEIHGYDAMVWRAPAQEKWRAAHEFLATHLAGDERFVDAPAADVA
jgi:acetyl esterase